VTHVPPPLPKAGSGAWKEAWAAALKVLDAPRTVLVIEGALDRKTSEELVQKLTRGAMGRLNDVPRAELVGRIADAFIRVPDAAWAIARELDRAAHKERHIVASIAEASVQERIETYRAIDFRRERARLIWALLRDGRDAHAAGAERILAEAFEQMHKSAELAAAESAPETAAAPPVLEALKERLATYEEALQKQQKDLQAGERAKADAERERSELLVRVGQRERALRDEEKLRRDAQDELEQLRAEHEALKERVVEAEAAQSPQARAELEKLRERTRALESKVQKREAHEESSPSGVDLAALERRLDEAQRAHEKERARLERELQDATARVDDERRRVTELREELKAARQALSAPAHVLPERGEARVGVFVDAANLSASARRDLGSKLDYRVLLDHVLDGRKRSAAIAFVVKEGDAYGGFASSLRDAGYELFEKVPKQRADGSKKADWDMGIAMEILDRLPDLDVIILCSGDGDYLPLLKRLKRDGRRVEVAAFRSSTDDAIVRAADAFWPLDGRFRMTS
jgi:uncharacterized LabA/DUF88 family protein